MGKEPTYCCLFIIVLLVQVLGVQLSQFSKSTRLILEKLQCLAVEVMFHNVLFQLIICVESVQVLQSLGGTIEIVVNLKLPTKLRKCLKLPQEG
jgi:hypothetical protein